MILVVQLGVNANEAKVFKAHAVSSGAVSQPDHCAQAAGEPAKSWRQPDSKPL